MLGISGPTIIAGDNHNVQLLLTSDLHLSIVPQKTKSGTMLNSRIS